jgi:Protein kinase domain
MPEWKQCEGELAGGEFPLESYLGGSEASGVFRTRYASNRAAVKLVIAGQTQSGELVERWNRAATLDHPHLVRIFAAGTWSLAGVPMAFLVMEYAEENLAEVLRERPLTTDETREVLEPVADALAYLHRKGLVHGNLKPSNILAVEDTLKISSEAVSAGDPAGDIRALGVIPIQALTQQAVMATQGGSYPAVDALPAPFRELAQNCIHDDLRLRWSAGQVGAWLRSPELPNSTLATPAPPVTKPAAGETRPRNYFAVTAIVVGVAIAGGLIKYWTNASAPSATKPVLPAPASAPPGLAPPVQVATPKPAPPVPVDRGGEPPHDIGVARDGIIRRVLPDIPAKARNSVHGTATVVIGIAVDPAGKVIRATAERGGSPYFSKLAIEAAQHWQFVSVEGESPRHWILRFEINRTETRVVPLKAGPE